jgi:hypothetical protein
MMFDINSENSIRNLNYCRIKILRWLIRSRDRHIKSEWDFNRDDLELNFLIKMNNRQRTIQCYEFKIPWSFLYYQLYHCSRIFNLWQNINKITEIINWVWMMKKTRNQVIKRNRGGTIYVEGGERLLDLLKVTHTNYSKYHHFFPRSLQHDQFHHLQIPLSEINSRVSFHSYHNFVLKFIFISLFHLTILFWSRVQLITAPTIYIMCSDRAWTQFQRVGASPCP